MKEKLQSFFGGVMTGIKPDMLPPFASPFGANAFVDQIAGEQGKVRRRKGALTDSEEPLEDEPEVLGIFHYPGNVVDRVLIVSADGSIQSAEDGGYMRTPDLYEFRYTFTNAEIKALPTTPLAVLSAPGEGYIWSIVQCDMVLDASAGAYTNIDAGPTYLEFSHSRSDNLVNDGSAGLTQLTDFFGYAGVNFGQLKGQYATEADSTLVAFSGYGKMNKVTKDVDADDNAAVSLQVTGNTGDFTGGNAANTLKVRILAMRIEL